MNKGKSFLNLSYVVGILMVPILVVVQGEVFEALISPKSLNGTNGFTARGIDSGPRTVSYVGDINGDGIDDVLLGGVIGVADEACVLFGKNTPFSSSGVALNSLDGTNGFIVRATSDADLLGYSASSAGDINRDGFADFIIGAPYANNFAGEVYVVFGKSGRYNATLDLSALDGTNGFKITGNTRFHQLGFSVSTAGDLNNDGFDDIIVGAPDANQSIGEAYVVFGTHKSFNATLELGSLDGSKGFKIRGKDLNNQLGRAVSTAGDLNNDGFDDIIIGAPYAEHQTGEVYLIFGKNGSYDPIIEVSSLNGNSGVTFRGIAEEDYLGQSVSAAGDINRDGFHDIIIGAPAVNCSAGEAYVVFGKNTSFDSVFDIGLLDGTNGFTVRGAAEGEFLGFSVSTAGDVNHDGFDDIIIGVPDAHYSAGEALVVFGKNIAFKKILDLSDLNGTSGFRIRGNAEYDQLGRSVSAAGDLNNDGFADIIVAAPYANNSVGEAHILFGRPEAVHRNIAHLNLGQCNYNYAQNSYGCGSMIAYPYNPNVQPAINSDSYVIKQFFDRQKTRSMPESSN